MALYAHHRLLSASNRVRFAAFLALAASATGCAGGSTGRAAEASPRWSDSSVNAVSRPVTRGGVAAVTGLRPDGVLETAVYDLASGRRLWSRPAAMAGRLAGMGVQPPAVAGPSRTPVVAAVEPRRQGRWKATLAVRDARSGRELWTRPVDSTFGPVRCGAEVCLSEFTARRNARFAAFDGATGRPLWRTPGIAEVETSDERHAVIFRMTGRPTLESRDLRTGRVAWSYAVERAVGRGVDLSGGWAFTALGDTMVGYLAPYQETKGKPLSSFGFFGLRTTDGRPLWTRKRLLRVYPSAGPAVALMTREVGRDGQYGDFAQLDPRTGRTMARVPTTTAPKAAWWLAFPADLSKLGFLSQDRGGSAFDLKRGAPTAVHGLRAWSFCTVNPAELAIDGHHGFFPIAPLCAYDLGSGRKIADPGAPPAWYTGSVDGWRVWRDEQGALNAVHDTSGTFPGMYG